MTYEVWTRPEALKEIAGLPGHIRQRIKRAINDLKTTPRPPDSDGLTPLVEVLESLGTERERYEPRRLRLDRWRVVYLIDQTTDWILVLAVRRRPPYDYDDLAELIREIVG